MSSIYYFLLTFEDKAVMIGRSFSTVVRQSPSAYTQLMVAVDFAAGPSYEVVIAGDSQAEGTKAMVKAVSKPFVPNKIVITPNQYCFAVSGFLFSSFQPRNKVGA